MILPTLVSFLTTPGVFNSPNYGTNGSSIHYGTYGNNLNIYWTLKAPHPDDRIRISFNQRFNIEPHRNCAYDYIRISNHPSKICGSVRPDDIISTSNVVNVTFRSDGSQGFTGFKARWSIIESASSIRLYNRRIIESDPSNSSTPATANYTHNNSTDTTHYDLVTPGVFHSPHYGTWNGINGTYENNLNIGWTLQAPHPTDRIRISFNQRFNLEVRRICNTFIHFNHTICRDVCNDYLRISNHRGKICGSISPNDILSTSNVVYVNFTTNSNRRFIGFEARWSIIPGISNSTILAQNTTNTASSNATDIGVNCNFNAIQNELMNERNKVRQEKMRNRELINAVEESFRELKQKLRIISRTSYNETAGPGLL